MKLCKWLKPIVFCVEKIFKIFFDRQNVEK